MKNINDFRSLFPALVELVRNNNHKIGDSSYEQYEDGWGQCYDYENNHVTYEEDGWLIEISYRCCGEWEKESGDYFTPSYAYLNKAWGEVTEISAFHHDEDTNEESIFEGNNLDELWDLISKELESIA